MNAIRPIPGVNMSGTERAALVSKTAAERALFRAMAEVFSESDFKGRQLAIERQNKRLAEIHRDELEKQGWVL